MKAVSYFSKKLHFRFLTVHWICLCALQLRLTTALKHFKIKKTFSLETEKNCQEIVRLYICFMKFSFTFLKKMQKKITVSMDWFIYDRDLLHERVKLKQFPENYLPTNLKTLFYVFKVIHINGKWLIIICSVLSTKEDGQKLLMILSHLENFEQLQVNIVSPLKTLDM